jgi:uncharacterized LabA/DUF88 family protein
MKTNIYIDGFNLYYGAIKNTPYRWLNPAAMCRYLLPGDEINRIVYCTALVDPRPGDPDKRLRQELFWRALRTIPNLELVLGSFQTHEVKLPLAPPASGFARVLRTEEKGSDVNLATHLLIDGFRDNYELAVVVSNDSDLLLPIQFVTRELGKPVGMLNPHKHPSVTLLPHVRFVKHIRKGVLAKSQFPHTLTDADGEFSKPESW